MKIDVPWGTLAGKWWGSKNHRPILSLHGWQDNAATFDTLIPLLPKHVGYLALDLPGHGFSSRIPDGFYYSTAHVLHILNIIRDKYKWEKLSLMAHSLSAVVSFLYAAIFPERCDLLIQLDALKPHQTSADRAIKHFIKLGDEFTVADLRNQQNKEPPSYTYDEIIDRWVKGTNSSITKEVAPYLMRRALSPSSSDPNKFYFTRDARLKVFNFAYISQELCIALAKRIVAPHLFLKASHSPYYENKRYFDETIAVLQETNPKFQWATLDGTHHFQLTTPEIVVPRIAEFISKYRPVTENNKDE